MNRPKRRPKSINLDLAYVGQMQEMQRRAKAWLAAHPGATPKFIFSQGTTVIGPISEAIEKHYVYVDDAGRDFVRAMYAHLPTELEPTVTMVQLVIESLE